MTSNRRRPEHRCPPEMYYDEVEAKKYTGNTRMIEIQLQMSERAVELLALPDDVPCYILDLGCGSGLSGETLTDQGHTWVGVDISTAMLHVAAEKEIEGDTVVGDLGQGVGFRAGMFDGAIRGRFPFWSQLSEAVMSARGTRAVFQFYPENKEQIELVTQQAMKAGFTGGLVIDYPNSTKAKKIFLVLFTGGIQKLPKALGTPDSVAEKRVVNISKRERIKKFRGKPLKTHREWVLEKKARRRRKGLETRPDTKYTGRRRHKKI